MIENYTKIITKMNFLEGYYYTEITNTGVLKFKVK